MKDVIRLLAMIMVIASLSGCNQKQAAEAKWQKVLTEAKLSYAKQCAEQNQCQLAKRLVMDCIAANPEDKKLQQYLENAAIQVCLQSRPDDKMEGLYNERKERDIIISERGVVCLREF